MSKEYYKQLNQFDKEIDKFNDLYENKYFLTCFLNLDINEEIAGYYLYLNEIRDKDNIRQFSFKIKLDDFNKYDPHEVIFNLIVNGIVKGSDQNGL